MEASVEAYFKNPNTSISYDHIRVEHPAAADFHLHDQFEIYFFISGNVNYFIEKMVYQLQYGDLLLMNSHELHKPSFLPGALYERIVIHFDPAFIHALSSPSFSLLSCFTDRLAGARNLLRLNKAQSEELLRLFARIEALETDGRSGTDIMKLSIFMELLVFINRAFSSMLRQGPSQPMIPEKLVPVLDHIDSDLAGDLSLEALEHRFFINRYYLSRLFKEVTGSNLHEYIQYKRISRAKQLLMDGCNVTEACSRSGFNDYSNFLRMFKRAVGISPGHYRKSGGA